VSFIKTLSAIPNGEPAMALQNPTTPPGSNHELVPVASSSTILVRTVIHPITISMSANIVTFTSAGFLSNSVFQSCMAPPQGL